MSEAFWWHLHGGTTHFPIVLLLASVAFDFTAWRTRDEGLRRGLYAAGSGSGVAGVLGGMCSVVAGLFMTRGRMLGGGAERTHHFFVWPAVICGVALVVWRLAGRDRFPEGGFRVYLLGMSLTSGLMLAAGYSGAQMLRGAEPVQMVSIAPGKQQLSPIPVAAGRQLFMKNCAHCHGPDAQGDEGPDLHNLDWTDEQIAARILNGKKGQMTAFTGKMSPQQIREIIAYLRTLK